MNIEATNSLATKVESVTTLRIVSRFVVYVPLIALTLFGLVSIPAEVAMSSEIETGIFSQIEIDLASSTITLNEAQVLRVRAIRELSSLPEKYLAIELDNPQLSNLIAGGISSRCATATLLQAWREMDDMSSALRSELQLLQVRPSSQVGFDSPLEHFKLHYDTIGTNAVPTLDNDASGIPDFIERIALYADSSWLMQVETFGYLPPPSDGLEGGDSRYDIYFENISFFGFVQPELVGPESWNDAISYMVLNNNFIGLSVNSDPEGNEIGAAKATVAHEFQHSVQLAYDFADELWFMESSATWMEDMLFDEVNDNYNFFPSFHSAPQTALTKELSPHYYATFIWPMYLSQRYDTSLMRQAWEGARFKDVMEALADSLPIVHGVSRDSAFTEFVLWAYLTGQRDDGQHFEEAAAYPDMKIVDTVSILPVSNLQVGLKPQGYGSSFVRFIPIGDSGTLQLSFQGNLSRNWRATVVATRGANDHDVFNIALDSSQFGTLLISQFEQYSEVTLIGINLTAYSVSAEFSYSGEIISGAAVAGVAVTDTIAYTLRDNHVGYRFTNFGINTDSFVVSASDSAGWGASVIGPTLISLAAGADTTVVVSVIPPAGVLPGASSAVIVKVISQVNSSAKDSVVINQVVSIYRGDSNWDGKVNIADVTYLISWIFTGGSGPVPEWIAGDATCDGVVNIADITYLIGVIFQGLSFPVCNVVDPL